MGNGRNGNVWKSRNKKQVSDDKSKDGLNYDKTSEFASERNDVTYYIKFGLKENGSIINPNFGQRGKLFKENCAKCVVAYEAMRRGYDVEAQPMDIKEHSISSAYLNIAQMQKTGDPKIDAKIDRAINEIKYFNEKGYVRYTSNFEDWNKNMIKFDFMKGKKSNSYADVITRTILSEGNGSRGIMHISWKNSNSAHVINYETLNGTIHFIDSQSGEHFTNMKLGEYLKDTILYETTIMRTDNLKFDESFVNAGYTFKKREHK